MKDASVSSSSPASPSSHSQRRPSPQPPPSILARFLPTLTTTSHISAVLFSSFLLVHLASPLSSTLRLGLNLIQTPASGPSSPAYSTWKNIVSTGCTEAASRVQLLGRVYYQGVLSEPVVVWGAACVHILSSIAKRAILVYLDRRRRRRSVDGNLVASGEEEEEEEMPLLPTPVQSNSPSTTSSRGTPLLSSLVSLLRSNRHAITGYILLPSLLLHALLHRVTPLSPSYPINGLSPSELDYSFVHFGTRFYTYTYGATLATLVAVAAWHGFEGAGIVAMRVRMRMRGWKSRGMTSSSSPSSASTMTKGISSGRERVRVQGKKRRRGRYETTLLPALVGSALVLLGVWGIANDVETTKDLSSSSSSSGVTKGEISRRDLTWMGKRMDAVYRNVWPFSWL